MNNLPSSALKVSAPVNADSTSQENNTSPAVTVNERTVSKLPITRRTHSKNATRFSPYNQARLGTSRSIEPTSKEIMLEDGKVVTLTKYQPDNEEIKKYVEEIITVMKQFKTSLDELHPRNQDYIYPAQKKHYYEICSINSLLDIDKLLDECSSLSKDLDEEPSLKSNFSALKSNFETFKTAHRVYDIYSGAINKPYKKLISTLCDCMDLPSLDDFESVVV